MRVSLSPSDVVIVTSMYSRTVGSVFRLRSSTRTTIVWPATYSSVRAADMATAGVALAAAGAPDTLADIGRGPNSPSP